MLLSCDGYAPLLAESQSAPFTKPHANCGVAPRSRTTRDRTHTKPELVWGDEGPVNEQR
jgi:hypothetical protein